MVHKIQKFLRSKHINRHESDQSSLIALRKQNLGLQIPWSWTWIQAGDGLGYSIETQHTGKEIQTHPFVGVVACPNQRQGSALQPHRAFRQK